VGRSLKKVGTGLPSTFSCGRSIEIVVAVEETQTIAFIGHNKAMKLEIPTLFESGRGISSRDCNELTNILFVELAL